MFYVVLSFQLFSVFVKLFFKTLAGRGKKPPVFLGGPGMLNLSI